MDTLTVLENCYFHVNERFDEYKKTYESFYMVVDKDEIVFIDKLLKKEMKNNLLSPNDKMLNYAISTMFTATTILIECLKRSGIEFDIEDIESIVHGYSYVYDSELSFSEKTYDEMLQMLFGLLTDGIDLDSRKKSGSERTPDELIHYMLDLMKYEGDSIIDKRIIDPACGTGTFIAQIIKRLISCVDNINLVKKIIDEKLVIAYDTKPSNVFVTKVVIISILLEYGLITNISDVCTCMDKLPIYCKDFLLSDIKADYIVGNPPYIRLQNLSETIRNEIKEKFVSATGRFDIYTCFIEKADKLLKKDGKLCLITSNKYLTANYGVGIRTYLSNSKHVRGIVDLYDTKFFGAAVLPAIILCENNRNDEHVKYIGIKSTIKESTHVCADTSELFEYIINGININGHVVELDTNRFEITSSLVDIPLDGKTWNFSSGNEIDLKSKLEEKKYCELKDLLDVCVGIKTTADTVFVKPMTRKFIEECGFEEEVIYPLIQSFDVDKWKISWGESKKDRYIMYPHYEENGTMSAIPLEKIPNAKKYLDSNATLLKGRKYLTESKTRQWYECWVPQKLSKFQKTKIITRDIVSHNSFAMDDMGMLCQGNTFFLNRHDTIFCSRYSELNDEDFYPFMLGVLNSKVMEYYQKMISGCLYSQKYRYTTTNLNRWPIPEISVAEASEISKIVKMILEDISRAPMLERKLDVIMYRAFKLNDDEIETIESFLSIEQKEE